MYPKYDKHVKTMWILSLFVFKKTDVKLINVNGSHEIINVIKTITNTCKAFEAPLTSNWYEGEVVLIPTFPVFVIRILSSAFVDKSVPLV